MYILIINTYIPVSTRVRCNVLNDYTCHVYVCIVKHVSNQKQ